MSNTVLVTGASGHLGQRVVELLLEAGHESIIATTRSPEKLAHFAEQGVDVRFADFDEPSTLADAFKGADRLLLISTDAISQPGQRLQQHKNAIKAAEAAGVQHILYTSIQNPTPDSPVAVVEDHRRTEEAIKAANVSWTMLRPNLYTENVIGVLQPALASGAVVTATGEGKAAFVAREDLARAAAAALASSNTQNQALDITGPEAVSYADVAAIASDVLGKELVFTPVSLDDKIQGMVAAGLPEPAAQAYASFDAGIAQGYLAEASSTVQDLTGKPPMSVREFLLAHQEAITPNP